MADGDRLLPEHHVARYCFSNKYESGRISAKNFRLRPRDGGRISTQWVECVHAGSSRREAARRLPLPKGGPDPGDQIAFLNVRAIRVLSGPLGPLDVLHDGHPANPCHAVIVNTGTIADPKLSAFQVQVALARLARRDALAVASLLLP